MNIPADKELKANAGTTTHPLAGNSVSGASALRLTDNRPGTVSQLKLRDAQGDNLPEKQEGEVTHLVDNRPLQQKENNTGLPNHLKTGIESLSGISLDDVKVHRNSDKPAQLQAHAYAQGTNIHLGPGQEKHLPHEAWHVVQQKQGRVQATVQLKGAVAVNDHPGLEQEADVMGHRALHHHVEIASPVDTVKRQPIVQKKIAFSGYEQPPKAEDVSLAIRLAISDHSELLKKTFPDKFEAISKELHDERMFPLILSDMNASAIDYGEINLKNPQHIILFFKDAEKYLLKNYAKQKDKEWLDTFKKEGKEKTWAIEKSISPEPGMAKTNTFQIALLGTSASIAYYINANGGGLSPDKTVIIGKTEPWNPYDSEGRGIDFINHPMHMISPEREQAKLPKRPSGEDETFKGNAWQLSYENRQKMKRFKHQVNATITKVSRNPITKWYKIETSNGVYFAQKVISGLGIGPHTVPTNKTAKDITSAADKIQEKKRVMDLDTFQRHLKNPYSDIMADYKRKGYLFIGVAGPNAGVDAVYEATNLNMFVDWVVSGGPAVVVGMANKVTKKGYADLYFDYLSGWTISGEKVVMSLAGKWKSAVQQKEAEDKFNREQPGWRISPAKTVTVDYMVYANGPDVGKVYNIFDKSVTDRLELKNDTQGRTSRSVRESESVAMAGSADNVLAGIDNRVEIVLKGFPVDKKREVSEKLKSAAGTIAGVASFAPIEAQGASAIGLGSEDNTFHFIGGSMIRILNALDSKAGTLNKKTEELDASKSSDIKDVEIRIQLRKDIEKLKSEVPEKLRTGKTSEEMNRLLKTLSSPTLVATDQLTAIRTQIEALGEYMPGYVGTSESNLVTDDQTTIAAQIAGYYANIPGTLANWLTQDIIKDRNKTGVRPGTEGGSRAFIDKWETKLEALQKLFDRANMQKMATE